MGESGKRRLQFRRDALNAFNHPVLAVSPNNAGGADFMTAPSAANLTAAALPANFFTIPLGQNFYGKSPNSFDITTLNGYKLYQLRSAYATNFDTLYNSSTPRYIQLGVKLYF